jgi:hypothetical protein
MKKSTLMKIINELEPYEIIRAELPGYSHIYLCKENGHQLITSLENIRNHQDYINYYEQEYENMDYRNYLDNNSIEIKGESFLIIERISNISYLDDYISLTVFGMNHNATSYIPYESITFVYKNTKDEIVNETNKLLYELKGDDLYVIGRKENNKES